MRWIFANDSEMDGLPNKVDEAVRRTLLEVTPFDDPDLTDDEVEELAAQLGDYDLDDEEEELPPPPPPKPTTKPKFSMASMMKKAVAAPAAEPEPAPLPPPPPPKRKRGSYSDARKLAALGKRADVYSPDFITLRDDIADFEDRIKELRDTGLTSSRIAKAINAERGLKKDNWLTPTEVADYLKSTGEITRGPASAPQDLGSRVPHSHDDPGEWHDDCPACTFSTSFESEWEYPQGVVQALKDLGEFSIEEAIPVVAELPEFELKPGSGYSDVKLPSGYRNLADLVKQVLKGSGQFEPQDPYWSKKMFTPQAHKIRWRYVGGGLEESKKMSDNYCASCEEGNHHRCRSESCACCGGNAIREMFEAMNRPIGSQPFQDWAKLGQVGTELKRQADSMKGAAYQTQDGNILFYKNQMQVGEQPMSADVTKGIWSQEQPEGSNPAQGTMQSVFSPKV
jgi:hypothetical protein